MGMPPVKGAADQRRAILRVHSEDGTFVSSGPSPCGGSNQIETIKSVMPSWRAYIAGVILSMSFLSLLRNFSSRTLVPNSRSIMSSLTITLNDGSKIPWLGFGTGTALYSKDAEDAVRQAIQTGVIHLDGAQVYNNEESLGAGIASSGKPRSELYITTKLNVIPPGQTVRDTLVASLKKLQTDYVDLFLIHFPINHETPLPAIWKQFEEIQKDGLAKSIGVSNFRVKDFEEILPSAQVIPAVNQVRRSRQQLFQPR